MQNQPGGMKQLNNSNQNQLFQNKGNEGAGIGGNQNLHGGNQHLNQQNPSSVKLKSQEIIVIHVFDENRKVNKDFTCEKELLVTHMKYFEKYLTEATSVDDIDISVHCDIKIFEWLMKYL